MYREKRPVAAEEDKHIGEVDRRGIKRARGGVLVLNTIS